LPLRLAIVTLEMAGSDAFSEGTNTISPHVGLRAWTLYDTRQKLYFDLHQKMEEYGIEPRHTYNMDEKGFLIRVIGKSKRIFSKVSWESKEARAPIQDGSREWITALAAVCADREALPPSLIYQAERGNVRST
jgi:hypothetical protein